MEQPFDQSRIVRSAVRRRPLVTTRDVLAAGVPPGVQDATWDYRDSLAVGRILRRRSSLLGHHEPTELNPVLALPAPGVRILPTATSDDRSPPEVQCPQSAQEIIRDSRPEITQREGRSCGIAIGERRSRTEGPNPGMQPKGQTTCLARVASGGFATAHQPSADRVPAYTGLESNMTPNTSIDAAVTPPGRESYGDRDPGSPRPWLLAFIPPDGRRLDIVSTFSSELRIHDVHPHPCVGCRECEIR